MNTALKNCPMCKGGGTADGTACICLKLDYPDEVRMHIVKQEIDIRGKQDEQRGSIKIMPELQKLTGKTK